MELGLKSMSIIGNISRMLFMINLDFAWFGEHLLDLKLKEKKRL